MSIDVKGERLFVSALGNNTVEVIDTKAGKRVKTINRLQEPQGVLYVPATDRLYVANSKDGSVRIFDGSSYAPLKTLDYSDDADNLFLTAGRSPPPARSILESNNLEHAEQLQQLTSLMERSGATKTELATGNLLKEMVGTWGLEPETSTVSI